MALAKQLQNRLFTADNANGLFFTLLKDPERRQKQWGVYRADKVPEASPRGYGYPQRYKNAREWQLCTDHLTESDADRTLQAWNARAVPIDNGHPEAYEALLIEAARQNLPENYRTDLTRCDRAALYSPGWTTREFIWVLRTSGTEILPLDNEASLKQAPSVVQALGRFGDARMLWYHYFGGRLHQIDYDKALRIAKDENH